MENDKASGGLSAIIPYIILFSVCILFFSGSLEGRGSESLRNRIQIEQSFLKFSNHYEAIISNTFSLSGLYENFVIASDNISFTRFSVQNKITSYNNKIAQSYIEIQKAALVIGPVFLWKLNFSYPFSEKKDLPVLS